MRDRREYFDYPAYRTRSMFRLPLGSDSEEESFDFDDEVGRQPWIRFVGPNQRQKRPSVKKSYCSTPCQTDYVPSDVQPNLVTPAQQHYPSYFLPDMNQWPAPHPELGPMTPHQYAWSPSSHCQSPCGIVPNISMRREQCTGGHWSDCVGRHNHECANDWYPHECSTETHAHECTKGKHAHKCFDSKRAHDCPKEMHAHECEWNGHFHDCASDRHACGSCRDRRHSVERCNRHSQRRCGGRHSHNEKGRSDSKATKKSRQRSVSLTSDSRNTRERKKASGLFKELRRALESQRKELEDELASKRLVAELGSVETTLASSPESPMKVVTSVQSSDRSIEIAGSNLTEARCRRPRRRSREVAVQQESEHSFGNEGGEPRHLSEEESASGITESEDECHFVSKSTDMEPSQMRDDTLRSGGFSKNLVRSQIFPMEESSPCDELRREDWDYMHREACSEDSNFFRVRNARGRLANGRLHSLEKSLRSTEQRLRSYCDRYSRNHAGRLPEDMNELSDISALVSKRRVLMAAIRNEKNRVIE